MRRRLEAVGFVLHSQQGSHVKFVREEGGMVRTVIVPAHKEFAVGTLRSIPRQAGLGLEIFETL